MLFACFHAGEALLSFKTPLTGTNGMLLNWRQEDTDPCRWKGVTCDRQSKRVIFLCVLDYNIQT